MSKLVVVAVQDNAVGSFNRPFFVQSTGQAIRAFSDEVNRVASDNPMNAHPGDFALFHLGEWDDFNGKFHDNPTPQLLVKAVDVIVKQS